jgi:nucleoside-diphosphate-sugar epimerase
MKVFVTGASGFLGRYVVAVALGQGHQVTAMVRSQANVEQLAWHSHPNVNLVPLDLLQKKQLPQALEGSEAVIHLAAVKSGSFTDQFAGTVVATENLLSAMGSAGVRRLIAISTFSVYDYLAKPAGTLLDETYPIEDEPLNRDGYAQTKLLQEQLYQGFSSSQGGQVTIIRPGIVYGKGHLWNPCLGLHLGSGLFLRCGASGTLPLTYVENCAEAIVKTLTQTAAIGETINIVDDQLPSKKVFSDLLLAKDLHAPKVIGINWLLAKLLADIAWFINQRLFYGRIKMPGVLVPAKLQARFKPFHYSNAKAKQLLNWQPRFSLVEAVDRSLTQGEWLEVPLPDSTDNTLTLA